MKEKIFPPNFLNQFKIADWSLSFEDQPESYDRFKSWIDKSFEGKLSYLNGVRAQKRKSLKEVFPEFKSALVFLFPYKKFKEAQNGLKLASYSLGFGGDDYHFTLRAQLNEIGEFLAQKYKCHYHTGLDVEPVLERDLAYRSGLGWFGKNSMLLNKKLGSYFLIGSVFLSYDLREQSDFVFIKPSFETDHCGNCRACIDLCPTQAITENRDLIANQCISTFTIETFKDEPPPKGMENLSQEVFGCDICQDVCPWNYKIEISETWPKTDVSDFFSKPQTELLDALNKMSNREYKRKFRMSPVSRPGRLGMLKNLKYLKK